MPRDLGAQIMILFRLLPCAGSCLAIFIAVLSIAVQLVVLPKILPQL